MNQLILIFNFKEIGPPIFTSKSNIIIKFWRENQGYIIFTSKSNILIKFWRKNQGYIFSRCHWNNFSRKHNRLGKASILKMRTSKSNYNKSFLKNKPVKKFAKMRKEFYFSKTNLLRTEFKLPKSYITDSSPHKPFNLGLKNRW